MKTVKATREGLVGGTTASGWKIDSHVPFVALPSHRALGRFIRIINPATAKRALAIVMDIGPWNTHDDDYVFGESQPQAESGVDATGRTTNRAGIDLGERVWTELAMTDNADVQWEFITP